MKSQQKQFFLYFSAIFAADFPYIWPLAGPDIAEKGAALVEKLNFQAVIKSAASAASLDLQGSPQAPLSACRAVVRGLPCKSREAALAADLITA